MKILRITNISAKITHLPWHFRPLTHILKWFLYKGRWRCPTKPLRWSPFLSLSTRASGGGLERAGLLPESTKSDLGTRAACANLPQPSHCDRTARPWGHWGVRRHGSPGPPFRDAEPGSVICILRVRSRRIKPEGPSPQRDVKGRCGQSGNGAAATHLTPGARRPLPRFY